MTTVAGLQACAFCGLSDTACLDVDCEHRFDETRVSTAATVEGLPSYRTQPQDRLRCGPLINPLLAWLGSGSDQDRHDMVAISDPAATHRVIEAAGGLSHALGVLAHRTGIAWHPADEPGHVRVTAAEMVRAYEALRLNDSERATAVRRALADVPAARRLGCDTWWSTSTARVGCCQVDPLVATGWSLSPDEPFLRTHVVVIHDSGVAAVLTAVPVRVPGRRAWIRALNDGPDAVATVHEDLAGRALVRGLEAGFRLARRAHPPNGEY